MPAGAIVTSYSGYRVDATEGRVELIGTGFGVTQGAGFVNLIQVSPKTPGVVSILSWTDTKIVVSTPAYATYRHFIVKGASGPAFTATNINPQISTYAIPTIPVINNAGKAGDTVSILGSGLLGADSFDIEIDSGVVTYYNPSGPNHALNPVSLFAAFWSDTFVAITNGNAPFPASNLFSITPQDVDGVQNGATWVNALPA